MNIKKSIKEFFKPRLTTQEMEFSETRCGCDHEIISLFFDDNKPHFPTMAMGYIDTGQVIKIMATWNQHGECMVNFRRMNSFDLLTESQKEFEEAKPVFIGMLCFIAIITLSFIIR